MSQTTLLALQGLPYMHCTQRVKHALESCRDVEQAEVSMHYAKVTGNAPSSALIAAVANAGYQANLASGSAAKTELLTDATSSLPDAQPAVSSSLPATDNNNDDDVQLLLNGLSCASCVSKVQHALLAVPGVEQARVNLAERSALVTGTADPQAFVTVVEKAGYSAEMIHDETERRTRQQQTARDKMKCFSWQAALGLALGMATAGLGSIRRQHAADARNPAPVAGRRYHYLGDDGICWRTFLP